MKKKNTPENETNLDRPLSELEKIAKGIGELALIHRDIFLKGEVNVAYTDEATGLHFNAILYLHDLHPFFSKDELFENITERAHDSQLRIYTERNGKAMLIIDYSCFSEVLLVPSIADRFEKSCTKLPFIKNSIALWRSLEKSGWCAEVNGEEILLFRSDEEFLIDCIAMTFSDPKLQKGKKAEKEFDRFKKEMESIGYRLTMEKITT